MSGDPEYPKTEANQQLEVGSGQEPGDIAQGPTGEPEDVFQDPDIIALLEWSQSEEFCFADPNVDNQKSDEKNNEEGEKAEGEQPKPTPAQPMETEQGQANA